jgi:hypothetical protein
VISSFDLTCNEIPGSVLDMTTTAKHIDALMEHMRDFNDVSKLTPELQRYVEETPTMGTILRHPLCYQVLGIQPHEANLMVTKKRDYMREVIREKDWYTFIVLHERPYRLDMLIRIYERGWISDAELADVLISVWSDTELPELMQPDILELFRQTDFITDDPEGWAKMPETFTVFRGVDGEYEQTPTGMAWTLDRKVAVFFARRHDAKGQVYRYTAHKDEILAYITARDEAEVIIDFHSDPVKENEITLDMDYNIG